MQTYFGGRSLSNITHSNSTELDDCPRNEKYQHTRAVVFRLESEVLSYPRVFMYERNRVEIIRTHLKA